MSCKDVKSGGGGGERTISGRAYNRTISFVSRQMGIKPEGLVSGGASKRQFTVCVSFLKILSLVLE